MKALQRIAGALAAGSLLVVLLITAIEIAAYSDYGYYEREYTRLGVLNEVPIEMDDLMDVTREMMSYLRGNREDLVVMAPIGGEEMEFFNDQEKVHMKDCQALFLGGILIRRICAAAGILSTLLLLLLGRRKKGEEGVSAFSRIFPKYLQIACVLFLVLLAVAGAMFASDFPRYFTVFHHIFFRNDLWLFDPATSRLINIVPEAFWSRIALRCAEIFGWLVLLVFTGCTIWRAIAGGRVRVSKAAVAAAMAAVLALTPISQAQAAGVGSLGGSLFTAAQETSPAAVTEGTVPTTQSGDLFAPVDLSSCPGWPEAPEIQSEGALLMEAKTGKILYSKNATEAYYPASITKLMTALLVLENCELDEIVTFSYRATHELEEGSTHIARTEDEQMTVRDCLYALLLYSANEVAQALAEHVGGSIEDFAILMNDRAKELGCSNTHFANPSGLNNDSHYTCCRDMALIMRACSRIPAFLEIESASTYTIPATNKHEEALTIAQKHKMVKQGEEHYEGALAGKTGYTSLAGNTLVTYAVRGDMELICVIMKSLSTHYADTTALLNWGFDHFSMVQLASAESAARLGAGVPENAAIPEDAWLILPREVDFSALTTQVELLSGTADENGVRPAARVHYNYQGTEVGTATLLVSAGAETTAEETTAEESSEEETTAAETEKGTGFRKVRQFLRNTPRPDREVFILAIAYALDHWQITLGILVGLILLLLILILSGRNAKKRKRRNYRYGGYTSTKRTRKRGNKYTMRMK